MKTYTELTNTIMTVAAVAGENHHKLPGSGVESNVRIVAIYKGT
jgi:hypothetical protein